MKLGSRGFLAYPMSNIQQIFDCESVCALPTSIYSRNNEIQSPHSHHHGLQFITDIAAPFVSIITTLRVS